MSTANLALKVHPNDNVYVALADLQPGADIPYNGQNVRVSEAIPAKQKFTPHELGPGDIVRMYGVTVGEATRTIPAGGLLSRANLKHKSDGFDSSDSVYQWDAPDVSHWEGRTFEGYHRSDGSVGSIGPTGGGATPSLKNMNQDQTRDIMKKIQKVMLQS